MKIVCNNFYKLILLLLAINIHCGYFNNVYATSGPIKQSSVFKCGSTYYGTHGNPLHFHIVEKKDGTWISVSSEVDEPSCYADINMEKVEVKLSKCVDGDTVKVKLNNGKIETVRFLAVDTPELSHSNKEVVVYANKAKDYTCNLLEKANKIELEFDNNSDRRDKYGRLLAYVYADDVMLQKRLLKNGYAKVAYLYNDYFYTEELKKNEQTAKNNKKGIWKNDVYKLMEVEEYNEKKDNEITKKEEIWNIIWDFIEKILSKLFDYLESML